jgi:hypothetical protein
MSNFKTLSLIFSSTEQEKIVKTILFYSILKIHPRETIPLNNCFDKKGLVSLYLQEWLGKNPTQVTFIQNFKYETFEFLGSYLSTKGQERVKTLVRPSLQSSQET